MRSERGQASVEWIGIVLLVALALAALARFAPRADGRELATTLAHSVRHAAERADGATPKVVGMRSGKRDDSPPPGRESFAVPPLIPRPGQIRPRLSLRLPETRALLKGAPRGLAHAWRTAWLACLGYERTRYALLHPETRFPGYTIPRSELLRIANDCISPVDLVRDWPLLRGR